MLRLFTTAYPESDPARRTDYETCLAHNLSCPLIDETHVFAEAGVEAGFPVNAKLYTRSISVRPTYADFFSWINETTGPEDISIIANTDIFFDRSLALAARLVSPDHCLALSRWDVLPSGRVRLYERGDSQDVWIFRGPVRKNMRGNFPLGVYDCDNKIAWELAQAGYTVLNPSLSLRSYHLHRGPLRSYDPQNPPDHGIRPPFLYVEPDNAGSFRECWRLWRECPPGYFPWRYTWRKFCRTGGGRLLTRVWNRLCHLAPTSRKP